MRKTCVQKHCWKLNKIPKFRTLISALQNLKKFHINQELSSMAATKTWWLCFKLYSDFLRPQTFPHSSLRGILMIFSIICVISLGELFIETLIFPFLYKGGIIQENYYLTFIIRNTKNIRFRTHIVTQFTMRGGSYNLLLPIVSLWFSLFTNDQVYPPFQCKD